MVCDQTDLLILDATALINFRDPGEITVIRNTTGLRVATTALIYEEELIEPETRAGVDSARREGVLDLVDLVGLEEIDRWRQ